ncbi:DNA-binding protein [Methylocystis sp. WRRC1]|uniref:DNA-binding protein n=1 Tax=Methylocystis sp. WRRC1 TaxID=1732014 RepID=UPI001D13A526|nr:DNA-binding protein [Methylocystis sp. WRRC1]MCC3247431.1 DNA-binding protein [Methylocystis sp. WRRC1]
MHETSELMGTSALAKALGVSTRTVDRWWNDPNVGFPAPTIINRRKYFSAAEVRAWRARMAARSRPDRGAESANAA